MKLSDKYREIIDYANRRFDFLEAARYHLPLTKQDWEDMRQEALINIFKNIGLFDKYPMKALIFTLVKRSYQRYIRAYFGQREASDKTQALKAAFRQQVRFQYITKQISIDGETEIVCEPDIAAPEHDTYLDDVAEAINTLLDKEKKVLLLYTEGYTLRDISKKMRCSHEWIRQLIRRARKTIREHLRQSVLDPDIQRLARKASLEP